MRLITVLLLAGAPALPPQSLIPGAEDFDLKRVKPAAGCGSATPDAILVCGRRRKSDDIFVRNPQQFADKPLKAEAGLGGGATVDAHGEQHSLGGRSAPAAMVRFRIPF